MTPDGSAPRNGSAPNQKHARWSPEWIGSRALVVAIVGVAVAIVGAVGTWAAVLRVPAEHNAVESPIIDSVAQESESYSNTPVETEDDQGHSESGTVTTESLPTPTTLEQPLAPELIESTCAREPLPLTTQPSLAEVGYGTDDCPYYRGTILGPGERHQYTAELSEGDRLSLTYDDGCNGTITVLNPRGDELARANRCSATNELIPVRQNGIHTIQIEVEPNHNNVTYQLHLFASAN